MTWTYDTSLATDLAKVRLYIGDINTSSQLYSDEEINAMITIHGSVLLTAAALCDSLAAKFSRSVSFSVEGLSISNSEKSDNYRKLAAILRARASSDSGAFGPAFVGGISIAAMDAVDSDTDRTPSQVKTGIHDFDGNTRWP